MKSRRRSIAKLRTAIALALARWCAGVGCMLVSYAHGAAMSHDQMMSAGHSGLQSFAGLSATVGHDCCKARHSSSKRSAGIAANRTSVRTESATGLEEI